MTKLTTGDITHIAKLAKLKLTSKEIAKFQKQLSIVLNYISELDKVDTSNTEPASQMTGLENVFREDKINPEDRLTQEEALSGTEKTNNGYFVVPRII